MKTLEQSISRRGDFIWSPGSFIGPLVLLYCRLNQIYCFLFCLPGLRLSTAGETSAKLFLPGINPPVQLATVLQACISLELVLISLEL